MNFWKLSLLGTCLFFGSGLVAQDLGEIADRLRAGDWGWQEGENTCALNPQTISFSDNLSEMKITWRHTHDPTHYQILYSDTGSFTSVVYEEDRRTDAGDLVVWQLKMTNQTASCWRRTDWPSYACTPEQVLCASN